MPDISDTDRDLAVRTMLGEADPQDGGRPANAGVGSGHSQSLAFRSVRRFQHASNGHIFIKSRCWREHYDGRWFWNAAIYIAVNF